MRKPLLQTALTKVLDTNGVHMRVRSTALRFLSVAAVSAAAVAGGMSTGAQAAGSPEAKAPAVEHNRVVQIKTFTGKCLDVEGASRADRARLIQYRCHNGANQKFQIMNAGGGRVAIKTFANKYFDVEGASQADRAQIIQYRWNGGANQRFRLA